MSGAARRRAGARRRKKKGAALRDAPRCVRPMPASRAALSRSVAPVRVSMAGEKRFRSRRRASSSVWRWVPPKQRSSMRKSTFNGRVIGLLWKTRAVTGYGLRLPAYYAFRALLQVPEQAHEQDGIFCVQDEKKHALESGFLYLCGYFAKSAPRSLAARVGCVHGCKEERHTYGNR